MAMELDEQQMSDFRAEKHRTYDDDVISTTHGILPILLCSMDSVSHPSPTLRAILLPFV